MIDGRYFAELSDSDEGAAVHYDNEVIEASSDQEAIGKAGAWAASHRLGVVATLLLSRASGGSTAGKFIWVPEQRRRPAAGEGANNADKTER